MRRFSRMGADAGPAPLLGLGLSRSQPGGLPLPHHPADRPATQQRLARVRHGWALYRVRAHPVLRIAERARCPQPALASHGGSLVGQFLPLGFALLLRLSDCYQDAVGEPPGVGAQVDDPVRLGEPHPGLVEPGDQVLQVQRLADEPVPLPAEHHVHRVPVDQSQRLLVAGPVPPGRGGVLAGDPDVVVR
jgi:hypothetical protein